MDIKTLIRKEIYDGLRNYRFLIILAGILFFALSTPIMNKLLMPQLLQSQFPNMSEEAITSMLVTTQIGNLRGFLSDISLIGMMIVVFTLSGITAAEISEKTIILPITAGKRYGQILISKLLVYGSAICAITTLSTVVNYYYAGLLFGFQLPLGPALRAGMLQGFYMVFVLALLMLVGTLEKKPITTAMLVLIMAAAIPSLMNLLGIHRYVPSVLLVESSMLAVIPSTAVFEATVYTLALVVLLIGFTIIRLMKTEY